MKWLITGGCGFIGSQLVDRLVKDGNHKIRIVDDFSVGSPEALGDLDIAIKPAGETAPWSNQIIITEDNILNAKNAVTYAQGADVIVHLAANTGVKPSVDDPRMDCEVNVLGTFNYLDALRQQKGGRFVFASSGAPVGNVTPPVHEELAPHPVSPYGASKLAGEGYCSAFAHSYGVDTVALRFGNVYGKASLHKSSVVARFCSALANGEQLTIYGSGAQTRDFIHMDDLLDAVYLAATVEGIGGETFQIATNQETTVNEIADMLIEIAQSHGVKTPGIKHDTPRAGDVARNFSDTSKAREILGWQPKRELREGLEEVFLWFLENDK